MPLNCEKYQLKILSEKCLKNFINNCVKKYIGETTWKLEGVNLKYQIPSTWLDTWNFHYLNLKIAIHSPCIGIGFRDEVCWPSLFERQYILSQGHLLSIFNIWSYIRVWFLIFWNSLPLSVDCVLYVKGLYPTGLRQRTICQGCY